MHSRFGTEGFRGGLGKYSRCFQVVLVGKLLEELDPEKPGGGAILHPAVFPWLVGSSVCGIIGRYKKSRHGLWFTHAYRRGRGR
jgi:hypothetical protein